MNITISVVRYRNSVTQGGAYVLVNGERAIEFGENIQLIKPGEKFYGENIDGYASTISDAEFIRGFCKRDEFQKYLSEAVEKEKDKARTLKTIDPRIVECAERLGWQVEKFDDGMVEFKNSSPAGEDISFTVSAENAEQEIYATYEGFDVDEHIEMLVDAKRGGLAGVPSIRRLVEDAEAISDMLEQFAEAIVICMEKKQKTTGDGGKE